MSIEFYRGSPGKFDSRTLSRETLSRWTGNTSRGRLRGIKTRPRGSYVMCVYIYIYIYTYVAVAGLVGGLGIKSYFYHCLLLSYHHYVYLLL